MRASRAEARHHADRNFKLFLKKLTRFLLLGCVKFPALPSSELKVALEIMAAMNVNSVLSFAPAFMRLLVVEDEDDLRRGLEQALREDGYAVDSAADGKDGIYKAETWDYDAIVLDVMLPEMDGWEILYRLRKKKKTPVLMLTARDAVRDRVRGLDLGADDYLVKPFNLPELLARVRALIRRSTGTANPILKIDNVSIDTNARSILLDKVPTEMTAREYALIEFLALQRGKVVSRTDLYNHLFSEEDDSLSNLLDVHVCNIRKKLGKDFVQTRRGHGYVIE
jgi:two-component system, OmpR family, response regulator